MPAVTVSPTRFDRAPAPAASSRAGTSNLHKNHLDPHQDSNTKSSLDAGAPALPLTRALLSSSDRRCGPSTPAPGWKLFEDHFNDAMASAAARRHHRPPAPAARGRRATVSARKLAATLWESQEISLSRDEAASKTKELASDYKVMGGQREQQKSAQSFVSPDSKQIRNDLTHATSPASSYLSQRLRRRSSLDNKHGDSFRRKPQSSGHVPSAHSQVLRLLDRRPGVRPANNSILDTSEIEADGRPITPPSLNRKIAQRKIGQGPATSGELLKVLNRIWALEEQHNSSISVIDALQADLVKARASVEALTAQQKTQCEHVENLTKEHANEKAIWQEREEEAIRVAVLSIMKDLEDERKSKRKLDLLNKKGAKELMDVKKSLEKALQDLNREQKARELMENVCDELAREIGEDRAQVEELRRESAKVREEVEEERKMLQMAEVWREERVQMKLAEARLQLEEKNAALDKLRSELGSFLKAKRALDARDEGSLTKSSKESGIQRSSLSLPRLEISDGDNVDVARHRDLANVSELQGAARPGKELVNDCGSIDEDLHSIDFGKESLLGCYEGTQSRHSSVTQQRRGSNGNGLLSVDTESSPVERLNKSKPGQGNRQGLQRTSSSKAEALSAAGENRDRGGKWDFQLDSQWIDDSVEKSEVKERSGETGLYLELREGLNNSWPSDNEESQCHGMMGLTGKGRNSQGRGSTSSSRSGGIHQGERTDLKYEAAANSDAYANNAAWKFQSQGNSRELKAGGGSPFVERTTRSTYSPNREWVQYWSSPDPRSPRFSRAMKSPNDVPRLSKDNSLKARLLEAKLEGQQSRLRSGTGV